MTDYAALAIDSAFDAWGVDVAYDPGGVDQPVRMIWRRSEALHFGIGADTAYPDHKRGEIRVSDVPGLQSGDVLQLVTLAATGAIVSRGESFELHGDPIAEDDEGRVWTFALQAVD